MQPLTRGPEAEETKTMTVAWPHHACVPLSKRRQHHPKERAIYGVQYGLRRDGRRCPHAP